MKHDARWVCAGLPVAGWLMAGTVVAAVAPPPAPKVAVVAAPKAEPFGLHAVRFLDGPFKDGQDIAVAYLLSLEPERLLANFRKEAGLAPRAPHYGGWESQGVSGHCGGHYLSGCAQAYAATGDGRFLERVNHFVAGLAECQEANGNGYVSAIPGGKRVYAEVAAGDIRSAGFDLNGLWVPNYTMHKVFAGLRDAYRLCGNAQALEVARQIVAQHGGRPELRGYTAGRVPNGAVAPGPVGDVPVEALRGRVPDALAGLGDSVDLIVMGARGLKGAKALGSVSERVAHRASSSVLVVRPLR